MLKVKWDSEVVTIETDDDTITFNWDEYTTLLKLLGEAKRLSDSSFEGELSPDEC